MEFEIIVSGVLDAGISAVRCLYLGFQERLSGGSATVIWNSRCWFLSHSRCKGTVSGNNDVPLMSLKVI